MLLRSAGDGTRRWRSRRPCDLNRCRRLLFPHRRRTHRRCADRCSWRFSRSSSPRRSSDFRFGNSGFRRLGRCCWNCKRRTRTNYRFDYAPSGRFGRGSWWGSGDPLNRRRGTRSRCLRNCGRRHRHWLRRRWGSSLGVAAQQTGDIARLGDVGEIDFGLDCRLGRARSAITGSARPTLSSKMLAHTLSFVNLDGARVCLLFRHSDFGKDIEDRPALDFQFPCQIVNSNFAHPPCVLSTIPLHDHHNPHEIN